jgi:L-fuconolactonase
MGIIDSQLHVWAANSPERPWDSTYAGAAHGPADYHASWLIPDMDAAGVEAAILVPPSFEGDRNDLALAAAEDYPGRFAVMGRFTVATPESIDSLRAGFAAKWMLGIRLTFLGAAANWLEDRTLEWLWQELSDSDVPVTMNTVPERHLELMHDVATRYPDLRLSFDHMTCGAPDSPTDSMTRIRRLAMFAGLPKVGLKVSALRSSFPDEFSPRIVTQVVDQLLESGFDASRLFWGSDYTRTKELGGTYSGDLEIFTDGISHLASEQQELILGEALREWSHWPR